MINLSSRSQTVNASIFNELAAAREKYEAQGINVYDLSIEMPDMAPSLDIREAVSGSATKAWNFSYSLGDMPQLKEAVFSWYNARYGVVLDIDEISSAGSIPGALLKLLHVLTDPGDKVLIQDPCSPYVLSAVRNAGCVPVTMPLKAENDFLPILGNINVEESKVMILSYPNNPTTATAPDSFYPKLIEFVSDNGIIVIHDSSYSDICYDGITAKSFLAFEGAKDIGVELNSLSTTYSTYGMNAGFVLGNADIIRAFTAFRSSMGDETFFPVQYGIIAALTSEQSSVEETISLFEYRRDSMIEALEGSSLEIVPCRATPFLWAKLPEKYKDDVAFTYALLDQAHVLVTPGSAFGNEGKGYIRLALNRRRPFLIEAANLIKEFI